MAGVNWGTKPVVLTDTNGTPLSSTTPIPVSPAESGAPFFDTNQVSVGSISPALLVAANANRWAALIVNTSLTLTLYVGNATVTSSTGIPVGAGLSLSFPTTAPIYGITSSSTLTAGVAEIYE